MSANVVRNINILLPCAQIALTMQLWLKEIFFIQQTVTVLLKINISFAAIVRI